MCIRSMLERFQYSVVSAEHIFLFASVPYTSSGACIRLTRSVIHMFVLQNMFAVLTH